MRKLQVLFVLLVSFSLLLVGCGQSGNEQSNNASQENNTEQQNENANNEEKEMYVIGVTQILEHPSLDAAYEGFKQALADEGFVEGENVTYDYQNAQNDMNNNTTIANNFVGDKVDLIFANSTPSAQAALSVTDTIPIVFTSVTDPVGAQLVESLEKPGGNVTGTTDAHPDAIKNTLEFMKNELGLATVGLIYNAGEQNSVAQIEAVKELLADIGMDTVETSVATSSDVRQAAESLVGRADSFYIVTDNTVVSAFESVVEVAVNHQLPLIAAEFDSVKRGALLAYGFEYFDIGYGAGLKAAEILKGNKTPDEIPVDLPQNLKLVISKSAAEKMGVEIQDSWGAELID